MADKDYCVYQANGKWERGRDGGGDSLEKYGNQNQGNMKDHYRKLNAHFCSDASQLCSWHID